MSSRECLGQVAGLAALALLSSAPAGAATGLPAHRVIETTSGAVAGSGNDVLAFKGIPFAAPPVGSLRWRPPQAPLPWQGVRDATRFGEDCMQTPYVIPTGQDVSEDCLTINVWTSAHGTGRHRPVMVFIYGGAFVGGSSAYPLYDGAKLAALGVVVVSFNYRAGIFGFLAHPMLSAESPEHASGNYGLLDQIAALKWVRTNIEAFGGDPVRVTVFGESAGAVSIAVLMTSPLAQGLFRQAILQSPAIPPLAGLAAAERSGATIDADLAVLRRLSAEQLLARNGDFFPHLARNVMPIAFPAPIVDGHVVPAQPRAAFQAGTVSAVPTIVGFNADEGRMFSGAASSVSVASYRAWVAEKFGPRAPDILRLYPAMTDADALAATSAILGDVMFAGDARLIARGISARQARTFAYVFSRSIAGRAQPATHSEELPFVFGSLRQPAFIAHPAPDGTDWRLAAIMRRTWTRFATRGNPNGEGLPRWPVYSGTSDPYLEFGTVVRPGHGYRKTQLDALEPLATADQP